MVKRHRASEEVEGQRRKRNEGRGHATLCVREREGRGRGERQKRGSLWYISCQEQSVSSQLPGTNYSEMFWLQHKIVYGQQQLTLHWTEDIMLRISVLKDSLGLDIEISTSKRWMYF